MMNRQNGPSRGEFTPRPSYHLCNFKGMFSLHFNDLMGEELVDILLENERAFIDNGKEVPAHLYSLCSRLQTFLDSQREHFNNRQQGRSQPNRPPVLRERRVPDVEDYGNNDFGAGLDGN